MDALFSSLTLLLAREIDALEAIEKATDESTRVFADLLLLMSHRHRYQH
jgi:hypothetical protein